VLGVESLLARLGLNCAPNLTSSLSRPPCTGLAEGRGGGLSVRQACPRGGGDARTRGEGERPHRRGGRRGLRHGTARPCRGGGRGERLLPAGQGDAPEACGAAPQRRPQARGRRAASRWWRGTSCEAAVRSRQQRWRTQSPTASHDTVQSSFLSGGCGREAGVEYCSGRRRRQAAPTRLTI
jgi:hypothetical protein